MSETGDTTHTILIVDDEPEVLESLRRTLRKEKYRILTTTSPREALELVEHQGVDLLLSDIDMPEMTGVELVAKIRTEHPHVVRLLLTGDASLDSAIQAINDGEVHRYLTKPWGTRELRETLRRALERLEELRRVADAEQSLDLRERLLAELESEHPGIRDIRLDGDVYVLDTERLASRLLQLGLPDPVERTLPDFDGDVADPGDHTRKLD